MTKRKSKIKCLLITSPKGFDFLDRILGEIISTVDLDIQVEFYSPSESNLIVRQRMRERDITERIKDSDLILVDLKESTIFSFFEIGIARAIGKPIVFIVENVSFEVENLSALLRQNYFIAYESKESLAIQLKKFLAEFIENPKRFTPRSLIESDTSSQIVVDLEKLDQRDFENLCFELMSRLGFKQLEWRVKDEFVDAVTTLKKQDPDGFEFEEIWLISFKKDFSKDKMFEIALNDPEYFAERIYRNIYDSDVSRNALLKNRVEVPLTLLFILRGKEISPKKLLREFSDRNFMAHRRPSPLRIRVRWWDEALITSLVQKNPQLARKYFSSEALVRSSVRLSYEELYKQYADINEQLQKTNQAYKSERDRVELLERDAAWKLLSFTAAHRIGNPIDVIDGDIGNLRLAIEQGKKEMVGDILTNIERSIEKSKFILNQFKNLSIAHEISPETVNNETLNEILKQSARQATEKNVKVVLNLAKKLPDVSIDVKKLSECFEELIRNALHFVDGDTMQITISTTSAKSTELPDKIDRTKNYIKITFSDTGCGVPFEKKTEIFKPFERSYVHGTGLGLAFCEVIIEKHGGKIREVGKPNEGATFEIFIPIIQNKEVKK